MNSSKTAKEPPVASEAVESAQNKKKTPKKDRHIVFVGMQEPTYISISQNGLRKL
jgi:hypothetical protein